jgi:hypothetical protein
MIRKGLRMRFPRSMGRWTLPICALVVAAALTPGAQALPPDPNNAALLYYQAFLILPQNQDQVRTVLQDLPYGVEPNDQIREYLKQCQPAIDLVVAATQIPACDWGLRYSQGFQMRIAHLGEIRRLAFAITDDSKVLVADGQYRQALDRCLVLRRMAAQVGDATLISYLVNISLNGLSETSIARTLSTMPPDAEVLAWLKGELDVTPQGNLAIQNAIRTEEECILASLSRGSDRVIEDLKTTGADVRPRLTDAEARPDLIERLKTGDAAFLEGSRKYIQNHFGDVLAIIDSPVVMVQKLSRLDALGKQPDLDAKTNPHALLAAALLPAISRVMFLDARAKSNDNMLKAAIEVYLTKAKTGSLPDQLPPTTPKDTFTGEDFKYEKTKEGFTLSRWTDDPKTDKTYQYEFKVK